MKELDIINYYQLAFIANAIYLLTFTGLIFITFRLVRFQRESNSNTLGKILVTIFGLCTTFYGYNIFSYLRINQLAQSFRLSELESQGGEISSVGKSFIQFTGYTVEQGVPSAFNPEPAAGVFILTFAFMVVAGIWMKLSKK
mgnify:CR=1 FL=1|tara:strand:- start:60 stop:485 length:426 start_codon:yes stop_codon:yes gene_type:complete